VIFKQYSTVIPIKQLSFQVFPNIHALFFVCHIHYSQCSK